MKNTAITVYGEVLFDHFPDGDMILGGAPFNVAWHLQAFGQHPNFVSRTGNDPLGLNIRKKMKNWQMSTANMQTDYDHPTGQVFVDFLDGEPYYDIAPNQAYDFIDLSPTDADHSGILYHGTLAIRSPRSKNTLLALNQRHQGKIFLDINLRQPWWNKPDVLALIHHIDWLKLNIDEFNELFTSEINLEAAMKTVLTEYRLEGIIVTMGKAGACALTDQGDFHKIKPIPNLNVRDTVGAGDAFCSVFLTGLNLCWDIEITMERAQAFASAVVEIRGAITDETEFYKPFLSAWNLLA